VLRIGLTGGIGSGKSAVARRFIALGVPVIDADVVAREVVAPGEPAYYEIVAQFGRDILAPDGQIDRDRLRTLVFANPDKRRQLEAIVHPRVRADMEQQVEALDAPYCVLMIPLLLETGLADRVDRVLVIDADDAQRIAWVHERDGLAEDQVRSIMAAQIGRAERLAAADDCICNDGSLQDLERQVDRLHRDYLTQAVHAGT